MTGCFALNCNNSAKKAYIMKVFPRDPEQRAKWAANVGRQNWNPTNASYLCEVHFDPTMWEKTRIDGLQKLKPNIVPTIFGFYLKKQDKEKNESDTSNLNQEQSKIDYVQIHHLPELEPIEKSEINPSSSDDIGIADMKGNFDQSFKMRSITEIQNSSSTSYSRQESIEKDNGAIVLLQKCKRSLLNKQSVKIVVLRKKLKMSRDALRKIKKENDKNLYKTQLKRIFTDDQIRALLTNSKRARHWSNDTIIKALRLKFACGERGYEELIRQNIPLPNIRTLQMRLQGLEFSSGISDEIFEFLKIKVSQFQNERDKECSLVMDEMSITPGKIYDTATHSFLGSVTLPNHIVGTATHGLVFMLGGLMSRWKQIVGYYFTGNGFDGAVLKSIILQILHKAKSIHLNVNNITSDMGPGNIALWREFRITAGRYSQTVNKLQHPCDHKLQLYILADAAHLLKNLKACILNNKFITIPFTLQEKYKLPTNIVHTNHLEQLLIEQKDLDFLLTPKLCKSDIECKNQFIKMRVNRAKNVLSTNVSSVLEFLADENNTPQYLTTA